MINLVSNACKFTESGTITVSVQPSPDLKLPGVLFSVQDTGIGIPKERIELLFKEFSQADTSTTREYGGTGLGLAISDRLCRLLGGEIRVKSTPGQGSNFSFILPYEIQATDRQMTEINSATIDY
jgi:signal transduction histidine kinase